MPRRGENIYKRKDGRWEGRLLRGHHPNGKAIYQYVYGKSYSEAKRKLLDLRSRSNVGADTVNQRVKYKDILNEWLIMSHILSSCRKMPLYMVFCGVFFKLDTSRNA